MSDVPYQSQSRSLGDSNFRGQRGENIVLSLTGGENLRLPYSDVDPQYLLQSDCVLNVGTDRELILSTTHTKPDSKGHSNENKFQLKLGEMWLWKTHRPSRRVVIVLTGREDQWLPWCLTAFKFFFDDAIYEWEPNFNQRIIDADANTKNRHIDLWKNESRLRKKRERRASWNLDIPHEKIQPHANIKQTSPTSTGPRLSPRFSRLRHRFFEEIVPKYWQKIDNPREIGCEIFRSCMEIAYERDAKEWQHLRKTNNSGIGMNVFWQCRSFFNPAEASIAWHLKKNQLPFSGGIASDVTIPSFMSALAQTTESYDEFNRTKMSEDFVLKQRNTEGVERLIYIQSKSSGGGLEGHGKAIQNRAKEQIARNMLYRLRPKFDSKMDVIGFYDIGSQFKWIAVIDNNWNIPKKTPKKNLHSLFLAGYDEIIYADELLDPNLEPLFPTRFDFLLRHYQRGSPSRSKQTLWTYVQPENLEIFTEHDEGAHGEPGALDSDFDY